MYRVGQKESSSEKNENRLRFDRIVVVNFWPHFVGPPCISDPDTYSNNSAALARFVHVTVYKHSAVTVLPYTQPCIVQVRLLVYGSPRAIRRYQVDSRLISRTIMYIQRVQCDYSSLHSW